MVAMIELATNGRNQQAREHLELLCAMRGELETAMLAIAQNRLSDLEESIAEQEALTARLRLVLGDVLPVDGGRARRGCSKVATPEIGQDLGPGLGEDFAEELLIAGKELQRTARIYARLLEHSSQSAALMASLLGSMRERGKEPSGPGTRYHTWSCQM
ncbi:MAG: hypothetical protein ACP5E5_11215 [Acidobacteriaceae bacterium]